MFPICADISKVQDDEVGDGTTSVTVLACELLRVNLLKLDQTLLNSIFIPKLFHNFRKLKI